MSDEILTPHQRAVATRVLDEEEARRRHLVVALSGAHAYGFASPDSDLDLKAIHVAPTARLLGLAPPPAEGGRMQILDGVEIDYTSNELGGALRGVLKGNGNYIERVLGRILLRRGDELDELASLVRGALSRRVHHHYRGFATAQLAEWEKSGARSAKKLLYVLRTTLTGAHLLATGELVTDVRQHLDARGFGEARELIAIKLAAEKSQLPDGAADRWRAVASRAFTALDEALARSPLPEEPPNVSDLEAWLVALRRRCW